MRTIDPEHNYFWKQGYLDGFDGLRKDPPDEARSPYNRTDYSSGYNAGQEDRTTKTEPTYRWLAHCWEDGPSTEDGCGTTCMLPDEHDGPHVYTRDDKIVV